MFRKIGKFWLIGILFFVPFQMSIAEKTSWAFNYIYQITIVLFLPFAIARLYKEGKILRGNLLFVSIPMTALAALGMISGLVNRNPLFITALGIFDYIKNFLVIFIYAAFFTKTEDREKIIGYLIAIGAFLGAMAFFQEIWAINFHYLFGYNIYHADNYILASLPDASWKMQDLWRLGIYRAPSLMDHPDALGLYSLLILFIYLYNRKEINPLAFFLLFTGVFIGVSRMVYAGFIFLAAIQFMRGRKWIAAPAIAVMIPLFFMSSLPDFNIFHALKKDLATSGMKIFHESGKNTRGKELLENTEINENQAEAKLEEWDYRAYAKDKALKIWRGNPVFGAGPGMFGGVVSVIFNSPVYKKYGFSQKWYDYMKPFRSLDQFWPQALAELGTSGTFAFAGLLFSIFLCFFILKIRSPYSGARGLFAGLAAATLLIPIYTFGSGLNETVFLFTYSALVGMGFGYENSGMGMA